MRVDLEVQIDSNFQTPIFCCEYMASLIPSHINTVVEPTKGIGNLVGVLLKKDYNVIAPDNFWDLDFSQKYECIVMNPPFTPMEEGYKILFQCMEVSDNIIALMPWLTLINSEKRLRLIKEFGLVSVTHLPRYIFPGSRVQCCILKMRKGFDGDIKFVIKDFKKD